MADLGVTYTDAALEDIEKQLKSVYGAAYKDMLQKQKDFNAAYAKKEAKYQAQLSAGQITQDQFDAWKKGQVFQGEQWQAKKKQILDTLHSSNKIAAKIVNGQAVDVFAFNANYQSFNLEHGAGINFGFGLYDSASVTNLIKNDPKLLPEWKIDQPKDYAWNQKKLNRQINLGIIEGESLDKIANRLCDSLSTQNFNHMRTFARTAMTGAQNAGREISLQEAQDKGINVKKEWMCTLDGHTRTNHRLLDGQRRPLDKPFETGGMKIRYPGDPTAHPSMVYNCRCTMVGDLEDYPATYDRYDNIDGKPIKNMTYDEWVKAKSAGTNIDPIPLSFSHVNIPTISASVGDVDDLIDLFKDKKMSNVYNDMKALDTKSANQFYKELKNMGKPSDIWQQYLDGTLPAAQADKITQMLEDYANKAGLLKKEANIAEQFLGKKMSNVYTDMKAADTKLANQFYKELKGMGKPSDVWQQYLDGTLDDDQKEAIEKYLKKYLGGDGKLLGAAAKAAVKTANTGTFDPSVYEETAKKAAKKFSNKSAADQFHRTYLDSIWDDLDNEEKYGIWEYTRNSNPMNKSLSGYHDSWNRSSFLGPDKTDWGHEDPWRSIPSAFKKYGEGGHVSYHKAITNTTKAIEKSQLPESCYLVRGSDNNGFAGMIEGGPLSFDAAKKLLDSGDVSSIAKVLKGQVIQNHAFTSTGIASGTGFGGQVAYRIYAPKGTKAIYAEPQSYFGNTVGPSAKLYKKGQSYGSVGGEAEVILQRGTKFRVTGVKKKHGALVVDMEVVEQPDYFKFGDEDTFNGGKTRHKK